MTANPQAQPNISKEERENSLSGCMHDVYMLNRSLREIKRENLGQTYNCGESVQWMSSQASNVVQ
jgi:hypothetical protein